jgi:hypothetical protein
MRVPFKYALGFDGVDDCVDCGNNPSLESASFTWMAWVKVRATSYGIMSKGDVNSVYKAIRLEASTANTLLFSVGNAAGDGYWNRTTSIVYDRWYHIAAVFDANNVMYLVKDGVAGASVAVTTHYNLTTIPLRIGALKFGTTWYYFNGLISEVCVYSRALSLDEILWNYNYPGNPVRNGLVLWLPGTDDAIQPPTWYDRSPFANNGTIYGATKTQLIKAPSRLQSPVRVLSAVR